MFLWQDDIMRRKAHHLMWPGKQYVDDRPPPALLQREDSLRQMPQGERQYESAPKAESPGNAMDAARERYKPSVRFADPYAMQAGQTSAAGVRYEPARPVKDVVKRFERKKNNM
jgi:hypothetical protein